MFVLNSDFHWSTSVVCSWCIFAVCFIDADYCPLLQCGMYNLCQTHMPEIFILWKPFFQVWVRLSNWEWSVGKIAIIQWLSPYAFIFFSVLVHSLWNNFSYWLSLSGLDLVVWNIFIMLLPFDPISQPNYDIFRF